MLLLDSYCRQCTFRAMIRRESGSEKGNIRDSNGNWEAGGGAGWDTAECCGVSWCPQPLQEGSTDARRQAGRAKSQKRLEMGLDGTV